MEHYIKCVMMESVEKTKTAATICVYAMKTIGLSMRTHVHSQVSLDRLLSLIVMEKCILKVHKIKQITAVFVVSLCIALLLA